MPRLCQSSALYLSASDVMSFLGRKLTGHFQGEVVTDQREVEVSGTRAPGLRVKHLRSSQHLREKQRNYARKNYAPFGHVATRLRPNPHPRRRASC